MSTRPRKSHLLTRVFGVVSTLFVLQSCYYLQSASEPIETIYYPLASKRDPAAKDLMVMLPGLGDYAETFERNGLLDEVRERKLGMDVIAVNAHIGYYSDRTLLTRLQEDVVEPAFAKGYRRIHFMGISLGGYGTLLYMREHPEHVSSAILLGPYLGEPEFYGYLLDLVAGRKNVVDEANIWAWLADLPEDTRRTIYLGHGKSDRYAESHRLLRRFLPPQNTISVEGAHDWSAWRILWSRLLSRAEPLKGAAAMEKAEMKNR